MAHLQLVISEAQILGLFLSSVFWGIYLVTFFPCMRHLLWDAQGNFRSVKSINWTMLIFALLLAFFATFDVALSLMHAIEAFILYTGPGGSEERYTRLTDWVNIMKTVNVFVGKQISDGILVYRCWIVTNKSYFLLILPVMLWLGDLAMTIFITFLEATAGNTHELLTGGESTITAVITSAWSMSIANNIMTTAMIVWFIRRVDKHNAMYVVQTSNHNHTIGSENHKRFKRKTTKLQNVIRIVVESGLMYTVTAVIAFITFVTGNNSFYATTDVELQVLAIAYNLIIIRVSSRPSEDYDIRSAVAATIPLHDMTVSTNKKPGTTTEPQQIMVQYEVDVDYDEDTEAHRYKNRSSQEHAA
ncbi:hypothetical protein D9757_009595 [Collybiopsis confluens]|uniref:Uncharacterized protein n=1 Tax=Collybiopsis confluens TaxID=2823264 RepID=A0A8H5H4L4_9AGAR|nr:hypothetical protein D9757_009595 [Collybiopsis confluens]